MRHPLLESATAALSSSAGTGSHQTAPRAPPVRRASVRRSQRSPVVASPHMTARPPLSTTGRPVAEPASRTAAQRRAYGRGQAVPVLP